MQRSASAKIMSKARKNSNGNRGDIRSEYRFDYRHARGNRFAERMSRDVVTVVLEPDVASVFNSSEAVNSLLRSVITALPPSARKGSSRKQNRKAS